MHKFILTLMLLIVSLNQVVHASDSPIIKDIYPENRTLFNASDEILNAEEQLTDTCSMLFTGDPSRTELPQQFTAQQVRGILFGFQKIVAARILNTLFDGPNLPQDTTPEISQALQVKVLQNFSWLKDATLKAPLHDLLMNPAIEEAQHREAALQEKLNFQEKDAEVFIQILEATKRELNRTINLNCTLQGRLFQTETKLSESEKEIIRLKA